MTGAIIELVLEHMHMGSAVLDVMVAGEVLRRVAAWLWPPIWRRALSRREQLDDELRARLERM